MCKSNGIIFRLRLYVALSFVFLLCSFGATAQTENLNQNLQISEPLWTTLSQLTEDLPKAIDNYKQTWMEQMISLQNQISLLQDKNKQLEINNLSLENSNLSLTLLNEDLKNSLIASKKDLETSEIERLRLETDLKNSISYTTQAQIEANKIGLQNMLLKAGCVSLSIVSVDLAVKAFTGKDCIEWILSLVK